jgi:hypothetical protein
MKQSMLDDPWAPLVQQMLGFLDPSEANRSFAAAPHLPPHGVDAAGAVGTSNGGSNGNNNEEEIDIDDAGASEADEVEDEEPHSGEVAVSGGQG